MQRLVAARYIIEKLGAVHDVVIPQFQERLRSAIVEALGRLSDSNVETNLRKIGGVIEVLGVRVTEVRSRTTDYIDFEGGQMEPTVYSALAVTSMSRKCV